MGGSDQWGNIVTGTELIRRKSQGEAFALTTPLIKKADGTKFGKTEGGSVWLDRAKTSPYKFYQFWLNSSDDDVKNYIRIFTLKTREEIEALEAQHLLEPHLRILQKTVAEELTERVHSSEDLKAAIDASELLFKKGDDAIAAFKNLSSTLFNDIFEGVPQSTVSISDFETGINIISLLTDKTGFLPSNGEARRAIKENSIAVNKDKVNEESLFTTNDLIAGKYLLLQEVRKTTLL